MSKKKVLVVDDGATNRSFIKTFLMLQGFDADTAADGLEGLEAAKKCDYALIFSDLEMPNLDGIGFLREVKKLPQYKSVPVIILSSLTDQSTIDRTKILGAVHYIVKPFNQDKMAEALKVSGVSPH